MINAPSPPRRVARFLTAVALLLAFPLLGCGMAAQDAQGPNARGGAVPDEGSARDSAAASPGAGSVLAQQMLVKQADVALTVGDVDKAAAQLRDIARSNGGVVTSEAIQHDDGSGETISTMTLSVPADRLDATLEQVTAVGAVLSRVTTSQDVTQQYVDTDSRVATLQRSVERLRALIDKATSVSDIAQIEGQLTQREADLESYEAQLKALQDSVAHSTVTVRMSTQAAVFQDSTGGFVPGLRAGWRALLTSIGVLLTVAGAALPFLLVVLILLLPVGVLLRRRRARRDTPPEDLSDGNDGGADKGQGDAAQLHRKEPLTQDEPSQDDGGDRIERAEDRGHRDVPQG